MSETAEQRPQAANIVTSDNLAAFQAQKLGLADPAPQAEATSSAAEPEAQSEQVASDDASANGERKQNPKLERRFSELTKQREQAKAEAQREREARETLEARLRDLETRAAPAQVEPQQAQEPKPEQFSDMYQYAKALAEYTAEQKILQLQQAQIQARIEAERQQVIQTWADRVNQAKASMPDFDDMIASSDVAVSDDVRDAIIESEVGPHMLYYLAENAEYAQKLAGMSPRAALKELGKLEAKLEKQSEKAGEQKGSTPINRVAQSKAPPPINPIKGGTGREALLDSKGTFQGSYAEYKAARMQGRIR